MRIIYWGSHVIIGQCRWVDSMSLNGLFGLRVEGLFMVISLGIVPSVFFAALLNKKMLFDPFL
jgi:hypothetical protein